MTATRYTQDLDNNGLAMELELPTGANYFGAQVVVFPLSDPGEMTVVAGGNPSRTCANSSWTQDGRLIFVEQDSPINPDWTRLKRASFGPAPQVLNIEALPLPTELLVPVDPHQWGVSDSTGSVVFSAMFQHPTGWMRPVWRVPAAGAASLAQVQLVGCPICGTGCCGWADFRQVLGTNDPRMDHSGTRVSWMQQHPNISFGTSPNLLHPYRQVMSIPAGGQVDQIPVGIPPTTSQTFGQWSSDDASLIYWAIELEGGVVRQNIYSMAPDGTGRVRLELPSQICPSHPSYLSNTEVVFSAHRCAGPNCSCDVSQL